MPDSQTLLNRCYYGLHYGRFEQLGQLPVLYGNIEAVLRSLLTRDGHHDEIGPLGVVGGWTHDHGGRGFWLLLRAQAPDLLYQCAQVIRVDRHDWAPHLQFSCSPPCSRIAQPRALAPAI